MRPPSLARSSAYNFADGGISLLAALIVSVLLARVLGPGRFGLYALVMTIVSFMYLVARLGIPGTVRRYIAELDGRGERAGTGSVAARGLRMGLISGTAAALVLAAAATPLAAFFRQPELRTYLLLGAGLLLPMVVLSVLRGVLSGLQLYRYLVWQNAATSPVWVAACAVAVWRGAGVSGVLAATLAIELANVAVLGWWVNREVGIRWGAKLPDGLRRRLVRYNLALAALILMNAIVWQRSELLFLGRFSGPVQVSFYAVPFGLTERVADLIPGAILGVLLPGLTYAQGAADPARFGAVFSNALRFLAVVTLPICLFGIPLAPVVIRVLYGPQFTGAVVVFQILLLSVVVSVLGQASRSALLGIEAQGWLLKTGAVAAISSIALDLVLIPRWGAVGAAIANTTVQAAWAIAIFAPLWHRLIETSRLAILKTAGVAAGLGIGVGLFAFLRPGSTMLVAVGLVALGAYGLLLRRLKLVSLPMEIARFS